MQMKEALPSSQYSIILSLGYMSKWVESIEYLTVVCRYITVLRTV